MRYEDASHTGAFQGSQPVANDDLDSLPAGSKTPATGNLISGEGTQTGSAGADVAAGAHVTAIAGKSGEDTSFAGGKLSVTGEHGKLSVDAEGNYIYQANGGVENVRDRFTYTLADNNGATDTGSLIVEIGKTPVVIKAGAQQIVPGPDGVVTLPPGVELSDVRVVGRNLVIDMPDGTQLIIIDGAIFVPQLVLGGVEVPSTNLAALLIGQEPQPAAGEAPQSSGGNFDVPVPPLDPGVPLGDLIPPTEYNYIPPEPQETLLPDDEEPTIQIQPDGQPASVAAVDVVDEDGLPTRNGGEPEGSDEGADGNPSNNSDTDETTAGTIIIDSPDGVDSVTINGVLVTGVIGQVIPGEFGNLTITGFNGQNILYSYTLLDNTSGDDTHDDFSVTITDDDGDQATATLTIDIIDDVPTARPDTDVIPAGSNGPATGNVITDAAPGDVGDSDTNAADTVGADNAVVTFIDSVNAAPGASVPDGGFVDIAGQYGTLRIYSNGDYSYIRNEGTPPGTVQDVFNYTITDGDGDTSVSTLTISIVGDLEPVTGENPTALLDDDALAGGVPGGIGDDPNAANLTGILAASGGDGSLTYDLLLTGAPAGFTYVDGPNGSVQVMQGGTNVLTITIDSNSGEYQVWQINPIDHAAGDNENNISFTINYRVTDLDGDTADGTLTIDVDDDTPLVLPADVSLPALLVDETNLAANDSADFSVMFNGAYGADGPGSTSYALSVVDGTDSGLIDVASGQSIFLFNVGSVVEGRVGGQGGTVAFTVSVDSATAVVTLDQILALQHPDASNPDDPVSPIAGSIQLTATIIDADGDPASLAVNIGGGLIFDDDGPSLVVNGQGPDLTVDETEFVTDATADFSGSFVADFGADGPAVSGDTSYALGISPGSTGLVDTLSGEDVILVLNGGVVEGRTELGNLLVFTVSVDGSGVVTFDQSRAVVHDDPSDPDEAGSPAQLAADNLITLTATITDGDGDSDSATINIGQNLSFEDDGPTAQVDGEATLDTLVLDETRPQATETDGDSDPAGLAAVQANFADNFVAPAAFGNDGPGAVSYSLVLSGNDVPSGLFALDGTDTLALDGDGIGQGDEILLSQVGNVVTGSAGGTDYFTISIDPVTGVVTFTQLANVWHADTASDDDTSTLMANLGSLLVQQTVTDGDGDSATADVDVSAGVFQIEDDGPVATNDVDEIVGGGTTAFGNVITGLGTNGGIGNGDDVGTDQPGRITFIDTSDPLPGNFVFEGFLTQIAGTYGTLTIASNGDYSYELYLGNPPGSVSDVFTYTLTDADGDSTTATLTIAIEDAAPNLPDPAVVLLDDDALAGGNPGGTGDNVNSQGTPGTLAGSGGDGPLVYNFTGINTLPAGFTANPVNASTVQILQGATVVLTITLNNGDGSFNVVQDNPIDHLAGDDENNYQFLVGVEVEDADGDTDPATINIIVDDDTPLATVGAQAVDTLVLDESRPIGTDTDGDSSPAGLATVQASFGDNFVAPVAFGADGPGGVSYSLVLSGSNVLSGLYALAPSDTTTGDGDGIGQGAQIILNQVGNVVTGSAGGVDYFTISIDPATGVVTFTQLANVWHANTGSDDDTSTLTAALNSLQVQQSVTDADNDVATASIDLSSGVFAIEDDGPQITAVDNLLQIDNDLTPSGFGDFAYDIGTDGPNAGNDDITVSNFTVMVNGIAVDPADIVFTPGVEDADAANYTFSFDYDTGSGGIATAEGTLIFYKTGPNAGQYEMALTNGPIRGFSILSTAQGTLFQGYEFGTSTPDHTQPAISVTQIQGDPLDPQPTDLFIQFTSVAEPSSGTGANNLRTIVWDPDPDSPNPTPQAPPGTWVGGELFNQAAGWVSTSNDANGVNGDTIQGGEVIDFVLVQGANPTGIPAQPEDLAQASTMFLKLDGISNLDDFIVILKLYDPILDIYTTRALLVENSDILKGPGVSPFIQIPTDQNDGLVFIEADDYNNPGENWVIVGAQVVGSDEGVAGTAINLNSAIGPNGDSDADNDGLLDTQPFSDDVSNGPFKISSIGFITERVADQSAAISFDVTITDADGDTETESIIVDIGDPVAPLAATAATVEANGSSNKAGSSDLSLASTYDNERLSGGQGNNGIMAGVVAAAGMMSKAVAAPIDGFGSSDHQAGDLAMGLVGKQAAELSDDTDNPSLAVMDAGTLVEMPARSGASSNRSPAPSDFEHSLDDNPAQAAARPNDQPPGDHGPAVSKIEAGPVAPTVSMPSAEALQSAALESGQRDSAVEQVVADALSHDGAPTVDRLLASLPGGNSELSAIAQLANPNAAGMPGWDIGAHGAFGAAADMLFNIDVVTHHHDAVRPNVNG